MSDLAQVALMTNDEYLRPRWWMADDLGAWLRREISEERAALRSVVLDIEEGNVASMRVAERLGATRRSPERRHTDRFGDARRMVTYVLRVR
jgi:hypothetical protein